MDITLDFTTLYQKVSRSLSIIGKRSIDDNGNLLFRDITLGSREQEIVNDFFINAFTELCAELNKFITAEVQNQGSSITSIVLTVTTPSNWNSALELSVSQALFNYCVSYALYSWFIITAPRISEKYLADATRQMAAIRSLIHEKNAPAIPVSSPLDIGTTVE